MYELLANNKEMALSEEELVQHVLDASGKFDVFNMDATKRAKIKRVLAILVWIGAAENRELADTEYYAFYEEIDTTSWKPKARV